MEYDWEGDHPLKRPLHETILYELHVRGFTRAPSSGCKHPGTFAALIEKIPYLKEVGITAVILLPVVDFDETEVKQISPYDGKPLTNYWGYDPISFFAPQSSYCVSPERGTHLTEFRDMVKAMHRVGIEVILDVVFNHTSEGNERGPTINFKGFANSVYYLLSAKDRQYYMDYSGCGNTFLNVSHRIAENLLLDALQFWVAELHVDGFHLDEAVLLSRDEDGLPGNAPILQRIELSQILADTKFIMEAWDAPDSIGLATFQGLDGENGTDGTAIRSAVSSKGIRDMPRATHWLQSCCCSCWQR